MAGQSCGYYALISDGQEAGMSAGFTTQPIPEKHCMQSTCAKICGLAGLLVSAAHITVMSSKVSTRDMSKYQLAPSFAADAFRQGAMWYYAASTRMIQCYCMQHHPKRCT